MSLTEIGKYELRLHLGNGAFGSVYLAHDRALDATKAIKIINAPNAHEIKKKLEEAQILHKCRHKNIVHVNEANVYDIGSIPHIVIDMEYLPRGSFEDAISKGLISIHDSVSLIIDCLFALEHAHLSGVLHRDIKPANIMLCEYGAKLSDFGLATVLGVGAAGSPRGYMTHLPPEYFQTNCTTSLSDIFAVGITLFRACNYILDWDRAVRQFSDPMMHIRAGTLASSIGYAPIVPLKLKKIVNKAISPNQNQRYQSAAEFRQALERLRPNINWICKSMDVFYGYCRKSNDTFQIELFRTKCAFNVDLKKNNRRQSALCADFPTLEQAQRYLYEYVSSTLFF